MGLFQKSSFDNGTVIEGLTHELSCLYLLECFRESSSSVIIVTSNLFEANQVYRSMQTYTDDVFLFPMDDFFTSVALAASPELKLKRLETIEVLKQKKAIVITNLMGYLHYLPFKNVQDSLSVVLKVHQEISRETLLETFEKLGYHRDSIVTSTGEYAVRGFVVDIFLAQQEHPIRIEFFGSEIESIRFFHEDTQRTINETSEIVCLPIEEILTEEHSSLLDYTEKGTVVYFDYEQLKLLYEKTLNEVVLYHESTGNSYQSYFWSLEELKPVKEIYIHFISNSFSKQVSLFHSQEIENFHGHFDRLKEQVHLYLTQKKVVVFVLETDHQLKEIKELFDGNCSNYNQNSLEKGHLYLTIGKMNRGFIWDDYVVISLYDIEDVKQEIKYKNNLRIGKKIESLDAIQPGDYVVHRLHGIGVYSGVVTLENHGLKKDYLQISYLDNDKVYIPVEKISSIYKYSDKDGAIPKVNKLGSTAWEKKKMSIQKKIHDISNELIRLYAKRHSIKGEAYQDFEEEDLFAKEFVYEETKDQTRAIKDILSDLDSEVPMDRLLCGDVGFGKTEVAFRAMFKAVCNQKQVFYLCPTTILSKQQYESACDRFKDFAVEIRLFNRFTTTSEAKEIMEGLESGKIDIVFGTHRLLNEKIVCKRLGLLVIDEEQRFGVTHKEKIKQLKSDVNVLTLSATPIPRTLKMSLSGLRDLSIIDTPPVNRYPVQTYVIEESDFLVRDAIYKELARDGQVFLLYNRIDTIEEKMYQIQKLVPEARIRFAHGQMTKIELDDIMESFVHHDFDLLLSTTIIETGIDIPNANTLIIYDADHFGLSQLYQLRGRVGRSNKIAYAYLMFNPKKMLNDVAVKRLQAIRDFTELGSGYKIAMRDLSIRGAGNILGSEQAGFVDTVGISLYMKMIDEEMMRIRGEVVEEDEAKEALINVETHIEDSYVSDESIKIEIHKMINDIDSYSKLKEVKAILEDRFGEVTPKMEVYMYEEWFEKLAGQLDITDVFQNDQWIRVSLPPEVSDKVKGDKLFLEAFSIHPHFQLKYEQKKIVISLPIRRLEKHFIYYLVPLIQKIHDDLEV